MTLMAERTTIATTVKETVYAYVKSEVCRQRDAVLPDSDEGLNIADTAKERGSDYHLGDWDEWTYSQEETLKLSKQPGAGTKDYLRETARLVLDLLDWNEPEPEETEEMQNA
jgi:hypothetical protein